MKPRLHRFWSRVQKTDTCWLWNGQVKDSGYGRLYVDGVQVAAHRYAWEEAHGPIPAGLQIDHLCRNRRCVRPSHLRVVDQRTNILCGEGPPAKNSRKTHCPKGHDYVVRKNGSMGLQRQCLVCRCEREKRRYAGRAAGSQNRPNNDGL